MWQVDCHALFVRHVRNERHDTGCKEKRGRPILIASSQHHPVLKCCIASKTPRNVILLSSRSEDAEFGFFSACYSITRTKDFPKVWSRPAVVMIFVRQMRPIYILSPSTPTKKHQVNPQILNLFHLLFFSTINIISYHIYDWEEIDSLWATVNLPTSRFHPTAVAIVDEERKLLVLKKLLLLFFFVLRRETTLATLRSCESVFRIFLWMGTAK